jgi:hyperosmotically inducible periplasmic protein
MTSLDSRDVIRTGGAALLAALLFITPAVAGAASPDDAALRARIEARLQKAHLLEKGNVEVDVQGGAAVLTGFTTTVDAQRAAEKAARKEAKTVENRVRVVPVEKKTDAEIQKAVADTILGYVYYGVFDSVGVAVDDGLVTLVGSVHQPWRKDELDGRVAQVEGVRGINNEIHVQPTSIFDDRLRAQLYRRIYGNDLFVRYANFVNPPIRIVVENGKVTLTGVVNSNVERVVLGSIANGTLAFKVDNQVQVESEMRKEPKSKSTSGTIDI